MVTYRQKLLYSLTGGGIYKYIPSATNTEDDSPWLLHALVVLLCMLQCKRSLLGRQDHYLSYFIFSVDVGVHDTCCSWGCTDHVCFLVEPASHSSIPECRRGKLFLLQRCYQGYKICPTVIVLFLLLVLNS